MSSLLATSRPERRTIVVAAAAGASFCVAWRATSHVLDAVARRWRRSSAAAAAPEAPRLPLTYDVSLGDRVIADVAHKTVKVGDRGRVVGLVRGRSGEAGRARVDFGGGALFNYVVGQQCHRAPLIPGTDYVLGDAVLVDGARGVVVGVGLEDDASLVVRLDATGERATAHVSDVAHAPLACGLVKNDDVVACAAFERVEVGDPGVVAGPCASLGLDAVDSRVLVDFGDKGRYSYTRAQLAHAGVLGTTFAKDDRVVATEAVGPHVSAGDAGVVLCAADDGDLLLVDFGDTRRVPVNVAALEHARLVQGHAVTKGSRVRAKVAYEDTVVGDVGTVLGPCDRAMAGRELRVCVLWQRTKIKNNWQPGKHIELVE